MHRNVSGTCRDQSRVMSHHGNECQAYDNFISGRSATCEPQKPRLILLLPTKRNIGARVNGPCLHRQATAAVVCFQLNSGQSVYKVPIKFRLMEAPWEYPCHLIPKVLMYPPLTVVRMKTTQADFYDKEDEDTDDPR